MNASLLARKGEAIPSGTPGGRRALAYAARRIIAIGSGDDAPLTPSDWLSAAMARAVAPRPAARILEAMHPASGVRHRFTFRLDRRAHDRFCAAAATCGCSRQELLERALDAYLQAPGLEDRAMPTTATAVPRLV